MRYRTLVRSIGISLAAFHLTGCVGAMRQGKTKPMEERPHPEFTQTAPGVWALKEDTSYDLKIIKSGPNPKYDNLRQSAPSLPPTSGIVPIQPEQQEKTKSK